jgi:hypothetical protein
MGEANPRRRELAVTAAVLAFGVVAWQHYLHNALELRTDDSVTGHLGHLVRDGSFALPLALLAVLLGGKLARGLSRRREPGLLMRAALTTELFMVSMMAAVPIHGRLDGVIGGHQHGGGSALAHALRDALIGQAVALPLLLITMWAFARPRSEGRLSPVLIAAALMASAVVLPSPVARVEPAGAAQDVNGCEIGAPKRNYDVSAIEIDMILNQWGDHDPLGRMYVLDDRISDVRLQEISGEVSAGLRDDPMQALVIRANVGECLTIRFRNKMGDIPASFNLHGIPFTAANAGGELGDNPENYALPGERVDYTFQIPADPYAEGTYQFNSQYNMRDTMSHGLFGMLVVEPAGSQYFHAQLPGVQIESGWEAIIVDPNGVDFREFVIMMHEIGNEKYEILDVNDDKLPVVDPITGAYRPGSRALNYRSEPFMNRLALGGLTPDKSLAYSSYSYGDPATPIPRSYLGEPTKTRIAHPGSEMFHVYHLHGGGIRWRRQPGVEPGEFASGLQKVPTQNATTTRLDSQSVGPGEGYTLEHECGAGGCQQAAGDFLFHCHIGEHYVAGMWSFWRTHDTFQPDLAPMPVDVAYTPPTIASSGTSVDLNGVVVEGKTLVPAASLVDPLTEVAIEDWVTTLLPPPGVSIDDADATVWDWVIDYPGGDLTQPLVLGEPETTATWPNYASTVPGQRLPVTFNLSNGRITWPTLRPHLAKRPPFAPNGHGGAAWLGEQSTATRPDGLCLDPAVMPERRILHYPVTAIDTPVEIAPGEVDLAGKLYVLNEDVDAVRAGTEPAQPLVVRGNVGDCLRWILTSEQEDVNHGGLAKVNIHNHFSQFDPQSSDGVITGFSYEQSVRPYSGEARTLTVAANPGDTTVEVTNVNRLRVGIAVGVGLAEGMCDPVTGAPVADPDNADRPCTEIRHIVDINGTTITLDAPLENVHGIGEAVGVEFVQYLWYADVDDGLVFFHDHVNFDNWGHGLFGAFIIEPAGSTWNDPVTGAEVRNGPIADIRAPAGASVGVGQQGPFREFVAMVMNEMSPGELSGINLRSAPLASRDATFPFSSVTNGDPTTPILRAYLGDDIVIRSLGVMEREGTIKVTGHTFQKERFMAGATKSDAIRLGISEREDLVLEGGAGGDAGLAGDFLVYNSVAKDLRDGAWGLMRVHDTLEGDLQVLPGNVAPPNLPGGFPQQTVTGLAPSPTTGSGQPCPVGVPVKHYNVSVFQNPNLGIDLLTGGIMYALTEDKADILAGIKPAEPLVLRINAGDCVVLHMTNDLTERTGVTMSKLLFDPQRSHGSAIGFNRDSTMAPLSTRLYKFWADEEYGISMFGDLAVVDHQRLGAYGAIVVEPVGATYRDPETGAPLMSGVSADIVLPTGSFREHVLLMQDDDEEIGQDIMPYREAVSNFAGINYASDPFFTPNLSGRLELNPDPALVFDSGTHGDPKNLFRAYVGDPVRMRVGVGYGEQSHVFGVDGHRFPWEPSIAEAVQLRAKAVLPGLTFDAELIGGAGSGAPSGADYMVSDLRMPFLEAGMWGILRTHSTVQPDLLPLPSDVGMLRVTTTPALPAQIIVDGIARDTWSLEWMKIRAGQHEVCFEDMQGFTTPACQVVDVTAGATTVVDGAYQQRGSLKVNTVPPLPATISIDGAPADDWGVWTDLPAGDHEVCFGEVADWAPPMCQIVPVTAGGFVEIDGVYTSSPGAPAPTGFGMLRVTTAPAVPAQILVDGLPTDTWSLEWVKVAPGPHEVCFTDISGFVTPLCQNVVVNAGATTAVGGIYTQMGSLRVDTSPAQASTILVDLVPHDDWGVWTNMPVGIYDVCFGESGGFTPPCEEVAVNPGALTTVTGVWPGP